jgi:hypothetical protein
VFHAPTVVVGPRRATRRGSGQRKHVPPGRITVISPHTRENSCLGGIDHLAGQRLSTDPLNRAGAVLCTTIHKFKGLESDVVILVDVRAGDLFSDRAFLYTAASRARVLLHVFEAKGDVSGHDDGDTIRYV